MEALSRDLVSTAGLQIQELLYLPRHHHSCSACVGLVQRGKSKEHHRGNSLEVRPCWDQQSQECAYRNNL